MIMSLMKPVILAVASAMLALVGCGGGSSGNTPAPVQKLQSAPAPQQPFNIASTTLTATDASGNTYTAIFSQTPNSGTVMFNGQTAYSSALSITILKNGTTLATEASTDYYLENPFSPLGISGSTNGTSWYFLFNSTTPYPTTLTVGDSGPVGSGTYYDAATNASIGSLTETYSVTANDPTTVLLNVYASGMLNGNQESETITYTVDASGNIALRSVQVTVNGQMLTFT
jgi:hypothetical protein